MYKIIRMYDRGPRITMKTGLTLAEAQAHCGDLETSSRTCTYADLMLHTEQNGGWFDGYEKEG